MATISYPYKQTPVVPQIVTALVSGFVLFFVLLILWTVSYQLLYAGRIFPGVSVAGIDLSGLSPTDASLKLNHTLSYPLSGKILFRHGEELWIASPAELGLIFDPSSSAVSAYNVERAGGPFAAL